jgi:hypothetical protein
VLLVDRIGHLCRPPKEVKVFSNWNCIVPSPKGVIIEVIVCLVELITKSIIGVFEIKSLVDMSV